MKSLRKHDKINSFDHTGIQRIIEMDNGCYGIDNFGKHFEVKWGSNN